MMRIDLTGKNALVTGSTRGIGRAIAQTLADAGARVGIVGRDLGRATAVAAEVGGGAQGFACDVGDLAQVAALIVSDVVGSPLDVIASGPTAPDLTTFADAWAIVERYDLARALPAALLDHLRRGVAGEVAETPKPGEPLWSRVHSAVIASNAAAAEAALAAARARGFNALLLTTFLEGEAREVGRVAAALARELALRGAPLDRPALLICGGETTVTLRGDGLGGRNQELALGAAAGMAGLPGALLVALATDGGDGPTDAAGAVVTGETLARARALGLDADDFLRRNDAYRFFAALDDLLRPGPTLTNVNDLLFIAVAE